MRIFKVGSGSRSVNWADCVVEAIRFGSIDGQKLPLDADSFLQRLSPRKPKANWSARNRDHADRLIAEGRMTPAGAGAGRGGEGRWTIGECLCGVGRDGDSAGVLAALEERRAARAFFATLDRKNLYPIYYRLQTAKRPETRAKRMALILARLDRGERFH